MYLRGSKFDLTRKRKRANPLRIFILVVLVGAAIYFNQVVVPQTPPLFVPTPTATSSPESYLNDAKALVAQAKIPQAIVAYQQAVRADPKNISAYVTLARLQIYAAQYEEAIINAENALLLNPNNAQALALRGWAKAFIGDYLEAESSLKQAIQLDPEIGRASCRERV